ncbi:hypothetical protein SEA_DUMPSTERDUDE_34 [Gordonia phage DumpsterDude]|uniref:Uncharacterized protein n=1 Tax=Gordonia phage DumpsterDude TaxID=2713262 RepID=A0A6G8R0A6_9CAUD|nr:hypothetical protein JZX77_gp34 [Gordonia phage DumpsterDude]QIN93622.1 hypothetical protein SEA_DUMPSTERDUDE_34 [Gordonia phage DumpsterDude]
MTDRETLRAAAQAVASLMRRQQANRQLHTDGGWAAPDPELEALGVECDEVIYSRRAETLDLADRLAAVLGDDWEP